ncbi:cytochrome P450 [Athelia psychrophila]|uniref:Cytochrome P450 n=1 Tax=Athelia psychrophila TaxID=1759441 RepID=A0A167VWZ4_9AGAM|nr:cytochrome P450 [Fibularhizoctonia sp. CBS 109695]
MAPVTEVLTALAAVAVSGVLLLALKRLLGRHPLDNLSGPPSPSFVKGNIGQLFNPQAWAFHRHLADNFGGVVKISGMWGDKQLYVSDPKALHHILVQDQDVYEETDWFIHSNQLTFGPGLLSTVGEQHRRQRKMLNPAFSPRHLADMTPVFFEVVNKVRDTLQEKVSGGPQEIDMLHWTGRAALELIGQSGLGYSFDDLGGDSRLSAYSEAVMGLSLARFKLNIFRRMTPYLVKLGPARLRRFLVGLIPSADVRKLCGIVDFMHDTSVGIIASKRAALERGDEAVVQQVGRGGDIMSILLKANMRASEDDRLPEEELVGQMTTLIDAAQGTTSAALARVLHLLAQHPDVQNDLRCEISEAWQRDGDGDGGLDYNTLGSLPYLDAVVRETLRLYAPIPLAHRIARRDTVLPFSKPIAGNDGREMTEVLVPSGTTIEVAIIRANREPAVWGADAYEWKPERWLKPLPASVADAHYPGVYSNMMTFLGGGRSCIGFKFSELEIKVVLAVLLKSFAFAESEQEIRWNMGGVNTCVVPKSAAPAASQLPLLVSAVGLAGDA